MIASALGVAVPGISVREFGQLMAEIGKERRIVRDYNDLHNLKLSYRIQLQEAAAARVEGDTRPVVVVAHLVVRAPEGYVDGLPAGTLHSLRLNGIMLVTCDPRQVWARRGRVGSPREIESVDVIGAHQRQVMDRAATIAHREQIPLVNVINRDGEFPEAVTIAVDRWRGFENGTAV